MVLAGTEDVGLTPLGCVGLDGSPSRQGGAEGGRMRGAGLGRLTGRTGGRALPVAVFASAEEAFARADLRSLAL